MKAIEKVEKRESSDHTLTGFWILRSCCATIKNSETRQVMQQLPAQCEAQCEVEVGGDYYYIGLQRVGPPDRYES